MCSLPMIVLLIFNDSKPTLLSLMLFLMFQRRPTVVTLGTELLLRLAVFCGAFDKIGPITDILCAQFYQKAISNYHQSK